MKNARVTVSALRVKKEQAAGRLGVLEVENSRRLIGFKEKPIDPKTMPDAHEYFLASMGVYIFKVDTLVNALQG